MKNIKFIPGYYEWHLIINDKLVWVENDGDIDTLYENNPYMECFNGQILESDLQSIVDDIVNYIRYEALEDYENENLKTCFEFTQEMFDILDSLTEEEWKQVWKSIHDAYANHYGVINRIFKYENLEIEAVGNILGGWKNRVGKIENINNTITSEKINREKFYKIAKKNKASCDVYRIIGDWENFYMLGNTNFMKVRIDKDFKPCDSYSRWYK